ncbi:endonuclease/exonuclease/phosphatase family domain-containing protein 1-like [Heptranchias perlo]|uniref:endonuclease/exonuclease/phosphatase family domain-containing protein 1-like n=1 Tax=Heptranchias perlo TaxID=212740 RepID=UPI003559E34B
MGYPLSCHRPQSDPGLQLPKARKRQRGPHLSATCNFADTWVACSRVNVNTAAEEQLMTLQGINRTLAHNMVLYRHKIGGFRKIEDVALVTGVGAAKLQQIRPEICVSSRESSQSMEDLSSFDLLSSTKLNINIASEKQLMALQGMTEELAHRIVHHRTAYGPFKHIDDLLQVTGMDMLLLSPIRSKLTVTHPKPISSRSCVRLGDQPNPIFSFYSLQNLSLKPGVRDRASSVRPAAEAFTGMFDGRQVVRIGSWNLQSLTVDKINNRGVREVICLTLLENGIKLLAMQEVLDEDALDEICLELEKPTIAAIKEWKGERGNWKYVVLDNPPGQEKQEVERVAFLWDSSSGLELDRAVSLEKLLEQDNGHQPYSQPLLGRFKMGALPLNLINVHLKAKQDPGVVSGVPHKPMEIDVLRPHLADQKQLIILGHFGLQPDAIEFNILRENHFQHCVPSNTFTNISSRNENGEVSQDNIWWNQQARVAYTGRWGVIREGLSSPWIPDGWKWGGIVSQHCPVWIEFFVD